MNPTFDERDAEILAARVLAWNARKGPRVGDFVIVSDGTRRRFSHNWGDGLQVTSCEGDSGSFYFGNGFMSYSGSLDPSIPNEQLEDTGETAEARAWFFHHDWQKAHNGVDVKVTARVYRVKGAIEKPILPRPSWPGAYSQEHSKLTLCSLTKEQHERTCGYWYTVTTYGATPHTAFRRRESLLRWLNRNGLTAGAIPQPGTPDVQKIAGSYRTATHTNADVFHALSGIQSRTLSNGDYVEAVVTFDPDGIRTVHTLNPNVKDRLVFDYRESEAMFA